MVIWEEMSCGAIEAICQYGLGMHGGTALAVINERSLEPIVLVCTVRSFLPVYFARGFLLRDCVHYVRS